MNTNYRNNWFYKKCAGWLVIYLIGFVLGVIITIAGVTRLMHEISKLNVVIEMLGLVLVIIGSWGLFKGFPKLEKLMKGLSQEDLDSLGPIAPRKYYDTFYVKDRFLCVPSYFVLARYDRINKVSVLKMNAPRGGEMNYYLRIEYTDGSKSDVHISDTQAFLREQKEFLAMIEEKRAGMNSK